MPFYIKAKGSHFSSYVSTGIRMKVGNEAGGSLGKYVDRMHIYQRKRTGNTGDDSNRFCDCPEEVGLFSSRCCP